MNRRLDVLLAPPYAPDAVRGAHVVAIDVLRATTTIATALANGAAGVVPVLSSDDALAVARNLGRERVLLCGERDSVLIAGFDLDNSPGSYARDRIEGKTLVFTTSNGTKTIRAAANARSLRTAALVNRGAVANALLPLEGPVTLLCAGDNGRFALEDALGAGAVVDALVTSGGDAFAFSDAALAAALLFRSVAARLADAVASAEHAARLASAGFAADLARCGALDALSVVPTLRDGVLTNGSEPASAAPEGAVDRLARTLASTLPGFRRYETEYAMRGRVNASLLTGALHAYVALAFREGQGEATLRSIGDAFEEALRTGGAAGATVEDFLERVADWPPRQREALESAAGPATRRLLETMSAPRA